MDWNPTLIWRMSIATKAVPIRQGRAQYDTPLSGVPISTGSDSVLDIGRSELAKAAGGACEVSPLR
jgi:hypothetical protein